MFDSITLIFFLIKEVVIIRNYPLALTLVYSLSSLSVTIIIIEVELDKEIDVETAAVDLYPTFNKKTDLLVIMIIARIIIEEDINVVKVGFPVINAI
jgi:hypothetical protein